MSRGIFAHLGPFTEGVPTHWTAWEGPPRSYSSVPPPPPTNPPPVMVSRRAWTGLRLSDPNLEIETAEGIQLIRFDGFASQAVVGDLCSRYEVTA